MMQVVPKWRVVIHFNGAPDVCLFISDSSWANVLRKLADLSFSKDGLEQPTSIDVRPMAWPTQTTTGVVTTGSTVRCSCCGTAWCPVHDGQGTRTTCMAAETQEPGK